MKLKNVKVGLEVQIKCSGSIGRITQLDSCPDNPVGVLRSDGKFAFYSPEELRKVK